MDGQRQYAGEGAEADGGDEDHAPDQARDRAHDVERQPHGAADPSRSRDIARRQRGQRQGGERREHGARDSHRQGFEQRPAPAPPARKIGRQGVGGQLQQGRRGVGVAGQVEGVGVIKGASEDGGANRRRDSGRPIGGGGIGRGGWENSAVVSVSVIEAPRRSVALTDWIAAIHSLTGIHVGIDGGHELAHGRRRAPRDRRCRGRPCGFPP